MDPLSAAILGVVQALTEFLPVSSSGHLVLSRVLLGLKSEHGAAFEVAVHFGTLMSVIVVFRGAITDLLASVTRAVARPSGLRSQWENDEHLRFVAAIIFGCVPAGVVGIALKNELESAFDSPTLVCGALLATGVVLLATSRFSGGEKPVSLLFALLIGFAQAVAIIPGVSRSGSTIATAMFLGVEREIAARFSFLLSLPVIAGATLLKSRELVQSQIDTQTWYALATGAGVAFVVGIFALVILMRIVKRGGFAHFGWYCLGVGLLGLWLI